MLIEIWSDVVCPFCYIGKRHLEAALATFPQRDQVRLNWRSFELDSHTPTTSSQTMLEVLQSKYGRSREEVESMLTHVKQMGSQAGLNLQLHTTRPSNTLQAHRLLHLAAEHGLQDAAKERLLQAYFGENRDLNDKTDLQALMEEVGLPAQEIAEVLASHRYTEAVREDQQAAQDIGITGVPFFVFNQRYAVSGAQPVEVFQQILKQAWEEAEQLTVSEDGPACEEDICSLD